MRKTIRGVVDKVTVTEGEPRLHVGDKSIRLNNVSQVLAAGSTFPDSESTGDTSNTDPS